MYITCIGCYIILVQTLSTDHGILVLKRIYKMIVEVTFLDYYNNLSTIYKHQYVCMSILIRQSTSVCITAEQTTIIMPCHKKCSNSTSIIIRYTHTVIVYMCTYTKVTGIALSSCTH